jgi:hypothetical protein
MTHTVHDEGATMSLAAAETMPMPRRWPIVIAVTALCILAVGYAASPLIGFFRLWQAAQAGDKPVISERVNFPKLRRSIARQLVTDAVRNRQLQGLERQMAVGVGTASLAAWLEDIISPVTVADMIAGRPLVLEQGSATLPMNLPPLTFDSAGNVLGIWWNSGFTSPVSYRLAAPVVSPGQSIALGMELEGMTWRVTSLTLPAALRDELMRRSAVIMQGKPGGAAPKVP